MDETYADRFLTEEARNLHWPLQLAAIAACIDMPLRDLGRWCDVDPHGFEQAIGQGVPMAPSDVAKVQAKTGVEMVEPQGWDRFSLARLDELWEQTWSPSGISHELRRSEPSVRKALEERFPGEVELWDESQRRKRHGPPPEEAMAEVRRELEAAGLGDQERSGPKSES